MIFPEFLKPFERDLRKYRMEYVKISAVPLKKGERQRREQSKFSGSPFLPEGFSYPCDSSGNPMLMIAQLNFAEMPRLKDYPEEGILQLFVAPLTWVSGGDYQVIFHKKNFGVRQSVPPKIVMSAPPVCQTCNLCFTPEVEYGCPGDYRFDYKFNGLEFWEYLEGLNHKRQHELGRLFLNSVHKIGGYADILNRDPREANERLQAHLLLFQMRFDYGEGGKIFLFIKRSDLIAENFGNTYMHLEFF